MPEKEPEFFLAGYEYQFTGRAAAINPGWRFRCVVITACPDNGERSALGWRKGHALEDWEPYDYQQADWDTDCGELTGHALPQDVT
jgi:hypothetical protein